MVTRQEDFLKMAYKTIQQADLMDYSPVRGCMILSQTAMKSGNIRFMDAQGRRHP